ncbi:MAG: hypothetical protein CBC91_05135 [Rickettsiales bacterium TMED131]|nr:MAG: hypothetical protein CBC91_05135 [Rickettsiales bacterium TMED131]|tara:strand:+ start:384 stop:968 length:585 start_codon:yes stop_codon:yes gene_type:complete
MIEVFDDLLDKDTFDTINRVVSDPLFTWMYNSNTLTGFDIPDDKDVPQMVRCIMLDTGAEEHTDTETQILNEYIKKYPEFYSIAEKAIERSEQLFSGIDSFLRIKCNMTMPFLNAPTFNPPHCDTDGEGYKSLIFYLNDSDGDTFFFGEDNRTVTPKANRGVFFDAYHKHSSSSPKQTRRRLIVNSVFKPIPGE